MPEWRPGRAVAIVAFVSALLTAAAVFVGADSPAIAQATGNRATFPANLKDYVLYAVYDRGSSKEEAFATRETIEIARSGRTLPVGTTLLLSIWKNSQLTEYFVMQKGADWGLASAAEQRTGDWHFQQFDTKGQVRRTAFAERCQSCHAAQASSDFMFTLDRMKSFVP